MLLLQTSAQQEFFGSPCPARSFSAVLRSCHTDEKLGRTATRLAKDGVSGGKSGLVPGDPEKSLLIAAIRQTTRSEDALGGGTPLDAAMQVADFTTWIKDGAYWPEATAVAVNKSDPGAQKDFFESRIRPVLAQQCFVCHTNSKMGGLRLDSRDDILKGGKSGPAPLFPGRLDRKRV